MEWLSSLLSGGLVPLPPMQRGLVSTRRTAPMSAARHPLLHSRQQPSDPRHHASSRRPAPGLTTGAAPALLPPGAPAAADEPNTAS
jgi:hypothetical protein